MKFIPIALVSAFLPLCAIAQQSQPYPSQPNVFFGDKGDKGKKDKNTTRPVHGVVKDAAGNLVPRAIVELKHVKTGKKIETVTRQDGSYRFDDLKITEDFELRASHDSLTSPVRKLSIYDSRRDPVINFDLEPKKDLQPQAKQ